MSPERVGLPVVVVAPERPPFPDAFAPVLDGGEWRSTPTRPVDEGPGAEEAFRVLTQILSALRSYRVGGPSAVFSLREVSAQARLRLAETLGEGEVTATVTGPHVFQLRETALAGLWRVEDRGEEGAVRWELLEVADVPSVVRAANVEGTCTDLQIGPPPEGAMNVLPVLAELRHRMQVWRPGAPNHVVSFTLLPMNAIDMRTLEAQLGHGPVRAEAKGHASCKVELTGHRHLWSVQFFNAGGAILLDTLEVGDVPVALTAAAEDFADSAARLADLLRHP